MNAKNMSMCVCVIKDISRFIFPFNRINQFLFVKVVSIAINVNKDYRRDEE